MNSRERVLLAVQHKDTDRVPFFYRDVPSVERRLLKDLRLTDRDELLRYFDIDFRWVEPEYKGPALTKKNGNTLDIWGVEYKYVNARDGGYWGSVTTPLIDTYDPGELDSYAWPNIEWFDFSSIPTQAEKYDGYAIMTAPGDASPGALAIVQNLIGIERAMADMYLHPQFLKKLYEKILDFNLRFTEKMFAAAEGRIDFFRIGDDFASQNGLIMSPQLWEEFIRPSLVALSAVAKQSGAYYYHHSCGAIGGLIPQLIELGVDVLDPLQVTAKGMDPSILKEKYGKQICFSGGVDIQRVLNHGTPKDVESCVNELLDIMAPGGGFFIGPTHTFQDDIPTGNIVAMYEAAKKRGC